MDRKQLIVFGGIFAAVVAMLGLLYFAFLKPHYAALYEDIRETDAAQIVAELDRQGIDYRLEDDGHRVMVPEGDVSRARVLVAGSGVAMGGTVGFEIFNQSDMGLTEFAQKVNYQRALQGELARTIMMMDGVRFARVHLSLPERTLFSQNQPGPKAAVTVQTQSHRPPDAARVAGIQQLVASAVPDLVASHVAVLDEQGQLLSTVAASDDGPEGALTEKQALEEYFRARIQGVAEKLLPGVAFEVRVLAIPTGSDAADAKPASDLVASAPADIASGSPTPPAPVRTQSPPQAQGEGRDFQLRVAVRSEMPLAEDDQQMLRAEITRAASLNADRGDVLRFEAGPLGEPAQPATTASNAQTGEPPALSPIARDGATVPLVAGVWLWLALAALTVAGFLLLRGRARMTKDEQQTFAELLSENIAMRPERSDGR